MVSYCLDLSLTAAAEEEEEVRSLIRPLCSALLYSLFQLRHLKDDTFLAVAGSALMRADSRSAIITKCYECAASLDRDQC